MPGRRASESEWLATVPGLSLSDRRRDRHGDTEYVHIPASSGDSGLVESRRIARTRFAIRCDSAKCAPRSSSIRPGARHQAETPRAGKVRKDAHGRAGQKRAAAAAPRLALFCTAAANQTGGGNSAVCAGRGAACPTLPGLAAFKCCCRWIGGSCKPDAIRLSALDEGQRAPLCRVSPPYAAVCAAARLGIL